MGFHLVEKASSSIRGLRFRAATRKESCKDLKVRLDWADGSRHRGVIGI